MTTDALVVHSHEPFNAEPSLATLRENHVTAQRDFYVRSHGEVPEIDAASFRLEVGGLVEAPLSLSLDALLERFPRRSVEAVLQCAGNRRSDMLAVRPVAGDPWDAGAIGNAVWTGVALADILAASGPKAGARHVGFTCHDRCEMDGERFRFGASIPIAKAMSPDVLLAIAMNGEPLAPRHGFPLRVVTPGYAGVRSPKWLAAIELRATPSDCAIQARDYKLLPPDVERVEDIDWRRGTTIDGLPVNSAICVPAARAELAAGPVTIRGWAMATARAITRVDVSTNGGRDWRQAELEGEPSRWSWTFWSAAVHLASGDHELVVRAWDEAGQTQPATPDDTWNVKGYLSASWHRVSVTVR